MKPDKELKISEIKAEILKCLAQMGITTKKIILFGSRARGNFSKASDYDFLVITEKTYPIKEKMAIAKEINTALASLLIPADIIIKSAEETEALKQEIGTVVREALKEGVEI